jgi:N-methylhydantoinase A
VRAGRGLAGLNAAFHAAHERLFTFSMDTETELVNLRAVARGAAPELPARELPQGDGNPIAAKLRDHEMWVDGGFAPAVIYERAKLRANDVIPGPAIVTEMDSTTVILGGHAGTVDKFGNILIRPV